MSPNLSATLLQTHRTGKSLKLHSKYNITQSIKSVGISQLLLV